MKVSGKLYIIAATLLVFAACNKENEYVHVSGSKDNTITLSAEISRQPELDTKVQPDAGDLADPVGSTIGFHWSQGDRVVISNNSGYSIFTLSKIDPNDSSKAEFTGAPLTDMSSYVVEYNYSYTAEGVKEYTQSVEYVADSFKPFISGTGSGTDIVLDNFMPVIRLDVKGNDKIGRIEYYREGSDVLTVLNCSSGVQLTPASSTCFFFPLSEDFAIGTGGKDYVRFYDVTSALVRTMKLPDMGTQSGNIVCMPELEFIQGLCFTAQEDGVAVGMTVEGMGLTLHLEYSKDAAYYMAWDGTPVTLEKTGDKVYFKADDTGNDRFNFPGVNFPGVYIPPYKAYFTTTGNVSLSGDIMYLLNGSVPASSLNSDNDCCFKELFKNTKVTDASGLVLPSGTLSCNCLENLFEGCAVLSVPPQLPSNELASSCYAGMFKGCSSLTVAPSLPAETLQNDCYHGMFLGCTALVSAPYLPAATLAETCYQKMFMNCSSLATAPVISATAMAYYCCYGMFSGCTNLSVAPALQAMSIAEGCYFEMFDGCTSLTAAPELPATVLYDSCYFSMFRNCVNLVSAPTLSAPALVEGCYHQMFYGCSNISSLTMLATDVSAHECLSYWLSGSGTLTVAHGMAADPTILSSAGGWIIQELAE